MKTLLAESVWLMLALLIWLTVIVNGIPATSERVSRSSVDVACSPDSDKRLERCLKKGNKLLRRYFSALSDIDDEYKICPDSENFRSCILPLLEECPHLSSGLHTHWRHVIYTVKGACSENHKKRETEISLECIKEEYADPLVQRCDVLLEFNQKQRTRSNCHFLRENINCKDRLITSKCGEDAGLFIYGVFRLLYNTSDDYHDCHLPRAPTHHGFRYTDGGCENFLDDMRKCVENNIARQTMLPFRADNELIVNSTNLRKKDIKDKCSNFMSYTTCMDPILQRCPVGPELIYDIDEDLRHYQTKMAFICPRFKDKQGYGYANIKCLNKIHDEHHVDTCNNEVWIKVDKIIHNVSSHDFHCKPEVEHVRLLKRELQNVVDCYEEVTIQECEEEAGKTLAEFITIIFQDPAYLMHEYRADCVVHGPDTTSTTTSTTTTATTTILQDKTSKNTISHSDKTHPHRHKSTQQYRPFKSTVDPNRVTWNTETKFMKTVYTLSPRLSHSIRHRSSVFVLLVTLFYSLSSFVT